MLAVAGGIILAIIAIILFLVIASSPLFWIAILIVFYAAIAGLIFLVFREHLAGGIAAVIVGALVLWLAYLMSRLVEDKYGSIQNMKKSIGRAVSIKLAPPKTPRDPRHKDHLKWANREGPYSDRE